MPVKMRIVILKAVMAGAVALASAQAQADIIRHFVRLGAFKLDLSYVPLTTSGAYSVTFSGSGRFSIWYTAECAASEYVSLDIFVDDILVAPTGGNLQDSFCDFETRGAMHTVTGRTHSLPAGTHTVTIFATKSGPGAAYLSDSSLLIGR